MRFILVSTSSRTFGGSRSPLIAPAERGRGKAGNVRTGGASCRAPSACIRLGGLRGTTGRSTGAAATAVLGQVVHDLVHGRVVRGIDDLAAHAALRDEAGVSELLQVKGERGWRQIEHLCNRAGRQPVRAALHQPAESFKAGLMGQRTQRGDHFGSVHAYLRYFDEHQNKGCAAARQGATDPAESRHISPHGSPLKSSRVKSRLPDVPEGRTRSRLPATLSRQKRGAQNGRMKSPPSVT